MQGDAKMLQDGWKKASALVVSFDEYRRLTQPRTGLTQFLRQSPLRGVELDLSRSADHSREVEL